MTTPPPFRNLINLIEMQWKDRSSITPILEKYPTKFVHFSKVKKVGINPQSIWSDPKGVYAYPVPWVLNYDMTHRQQYGFDFEYFFILDINTASNGIVLSKMTFAQLNQIAERNGWKQYLDSLHEQHGKYYIKDKDGHTDSLPSYLKPDIAGSVFWHVCDALNKNKSMLWSTSLKGIAYIYDDDNSIINDREPHQMLVLDPRILKVIDSGTNGDSRAQSRAEGWEGWKNAIVKLFKVLSEKYNGVLTWNKQMPTLSFNVGTKRFDLIFEEKWAVGIHITYYYGKAKGYGKIAMKDIETLSLEELVEKISKYVENIASIKDELWFDPIVEENMVHLFVEGKIMDDADMSWETTIENDQSVIRTVGTSDKKIDGINLQTTVYVDIREEDFGISLYVKINGMRSPFVSASLFEKYTYLPDCTKPLMNKLLVGLDQVKQIYTQDVNDSYYRPKFYAEKEWNQFVGWLITNSGLSFDDHIRLSDFRKQEHEYSVISPQEKKDLLYDIKRVMKDT